MGVKMAKIPKIENLDDLIIEGIERFNRNWSRLGLVSERVVVGEYTGPWYESVCNFELIDCKLAYRAYNGNDWLINFDGEEIFDKEIEELREKYRLVCENNNA